MRSEIRESDLSPTDLVLIDIDERKNAVEIGVTSEAEANRLLAHFGSRGLPSDGIVVTVMEARKLGLTLADTINPVIGGFGFRSYPLGGTCSIGFNAQLNGVNYFATASHCGGLMGAVDDSINYPAYQPSPFYASLPLSYLKIGFEAIDPPLRPASAFPPGKCTFPYCRYADMSFWQFSNPSRSQSYSVANTSSIGYGGVWGSTTFNGAWPVGGVYDPAWIISGYTLVDKVGRTSGHTAGVALRTCADFGLPDNVHGGTAGYLCQYEAQFGADFGDSGGPVWVLDGFGIKLVGTISLVAGNLGVFSTIRGFLTDLGSYTCFRVKASGSCVTLPPY